VSAAFFSVVSGFVPSPKLPSSVLRSRGNIRLAMNPEDMSALAETAQVVQAFHDSTTAASGMTEATSSSALNDLDSSNFLLSVAPRIFTPLDIFTKPLEYDKSDPAFSVIPQAQEFSLYEKLQFTWGWVNVALFTLLSVLFTVYNLLRWRAEEELKGLRTMVLKRTSIKSMGQKELQELEDLGARTAPVRLILGGDSIDTQEENRRYEEETRRAADFLKRKRGGKSDEDEAADKERRRRQAEIADVIEGVVFDD